MRSVKVHLSAQAEGYISEMKEAAKTTRDTASAAEQLAQKGAAFGTLGRAAMTMGVTAAAGVGLAVSKWADFDQAMSAVEAATHESADGMARLSAAAIDAGARTVFSAEESANAIEELAKAGVSTGDILSGGLAGSLDLAAAGGLGVAEAAGIAATALKTFNLQGSDMSHVADLLAAGAGKAMGDVTDLSQALNQSAMVANATGLSIEETTAGLAAFASQGLLGSDAGTSFKSMLQSLTPTSTKAAETMADLGISAYDSQGNFVGLAEFAGQLKTSLSDLTVEQQQAALKTIFGSDAIRAATVLYSEGEEGIREWISAVDDQGYAAETAAARLDNLKGDLEALGGAFDTALIQSGSAANGVMREMVQIVTGVIDGYNQLPAPLQGAALGAGVLTAAVGLLAGGFALAVPKIAEYKAAMVALELSGGRLERTLSAVGRVAGVGIAAGIATVGINHLADAITQKLSPSAEETTNAVLTSKSAVEAFAGALEARMPGGEDYFDAATLHVQQLGAALDAAADSSFWKPIDPGMDEYLGTWRVAAKEIASLAATDLPAASDQFVKVAEGAKLNREQMSQLITESDELRNALINQASAAGLADDENTLLGLALGEIGPAAKEGAAGTDEQANSLSALDAAAAESQEAIADLADEIRGFGSETFDMREANRQLEESYVALTDSLSANGNNFDIATDAGRQNEAALDAVARATNEAAAGILAATNDQDAMNAKLAEGKSALVDILAPYFESRDAAAAYVDTLDLISPEKVTDILANSEEAQAAIEALNDLAVPDKLFEVDADAASAFEGIDGVNVAKIDDKTSYVWGANEDARAKIQEIIDKNPDAKVVPISGDNAGFWGAWAAIRDTPLTKTISIMADVQRTVTETFKNLGADGSANGNLFAYANGGIAAYANGGIATGIYSGGAPIHKFAEPETGWEAYISGKPSERERNRQIWSDTGARLGMSPSVGDISLVAYIENPWGDGYLQAKVKQVANEEIDAYANQRARAQRRTGMTA